MKTITNKQIRKIFRNKKFTINKKGDFETTFTLDELNKILNYIDLLEENYLKLKEGK